jgi:hypothetical protein
VSPIGYYIRALSDGEFCSFHQSKETKNDQVRQLRQQWTTLTNEQKQPYEQMAAQDKQRYEHDLLVLISDHVTINYLTFSLSLFSVVDLSVDHI